MDQKSAAANTGHSGVSQPFRSRPAGFLMFVGAAILLGAAIWNLAISFEDDHLHGSDVALLGLAFTLASAMVIRGRKLLTRDAARLLANDTRPPVVYLRPFSADERPRSGMPLGIRRGGLPINFNITVPSLETRLARQLSAIGPFVAVGAPGEKFATLGAARMYLADDIWQTKVDELLRSAAAVVLQPETSAGTRWEIMRVARSIVPERVLLVVPNPAHRPLGYARIRALIETDFPITLPAECPNADLFMFDSTAQPAPLILRRGDRHALAPFVSQVQSLARVRDTGHA